MLDKRGGGHRSRGGNRGRGGIEPAKVTPPAAGAQTFVCQVPCVVCVLCTFPDTRVRTQSRDFGTRQAKMTAGNLLHAPEDEQVELHTGRIWSPPIDPTASLTKATAVDSSGRRSSSARKRPRTSSLTASSSSVLPPYPPCGNTGQATTAADELGQTRPRSQFRQGKRAASESDTFRPTQLPYLSDGRDDGDESSSSGSGDNSSARLSKSARLLEEDRKKVASIRSFLLNFLEERDCSIKKRLVGAWVSGFSVVKPRSPLGTTFFQIG